MPILFNAFHYILADRARRSFTSVFLASIFSNSAFSGAKALSCGDFVTKATAACITENGLQDARSCRAKAEAAGCGQQSQSRSDDPACSARNKQNVDWVFIDSGATQSFRRFRASSLSAFDAVVAAQAHNPPVQRDLRLCRGWVEAYLANRSGIPDQAHNQPPLTGEDCRCISVQPQGGTSFSVSNTCSTLDVSVRFKDEMNSLLSSWKSAGPIGQGQSRTIIAPNYELVSISAIAIAQGGASFSCSYQ